MRRSGIEPGGGVSGAWGYGGLGVSPARRRGKRGWCSRWMAVKPSRQSGNRGRSTRRLAAVAGCACTTHNVNNNRLCSNIERARSRESRTYCALTLAVSTRYITALR